MIYTIISLTLFCVSFTTCALCVKYHKTKEYEYDEYSDSEDNIIL